MICCSLSHALAPPPLSTGPIIHFEHQALTPPLRGSGPDILVLLRPLTLSPIAHDEMNFIDQEGNYLEVKVEMLGNEPKIS